MVPERKSETPGPGDAQRSKPHPDIFEVILKKLNDVTPGRILAVEDTPYDVQAAAQLSVRTIAVLGGRLSGKSKKFSGWRTPLRTELENSKAFGS
jgi:beta-phosphoglucomutase-like phosphatase (HAD superfamily)